MTAAYRLKGVGWFAGCTAIVLGFYLVSLQVASERKKLESINARIASTSRDIRALETEFDTRANLAQLERWNGDTLALSAPVAGQFVQSEAQFASMDAGMPVPVAGAQVKTAALIVPSLPTPAAAAPVMAAIADPAAPAPTAAAPSTPVPARASAPVRVAKAVTKAPPTVRATPRAAVTQVAAHSEPASIRPAVAARSKPETAARAKPQVAMLDRKLLSDTTLGDLLARARAERGGMR